MFRQKITDADRILATVLSQRRLCNQQTLAGLFATSRATIRNAVDDVLPLLKADGYVAAPAGRYYRTATDLLTSLATEPKSPPLNPYGFSGCGTVARSRPARWPRSPR